MRRMNWFAAAAAAAFTAAVTPSAFAAEEIYAPAGVTVTTTASGETIVQTPNAIDYSVLVSPKYDYVDLIQASQAGLTDKQVAVATKIADRTDMTFRDVVDAIQRGETYASLSERSHVPLAQLYDIDDQRAKITVYKEAYENTGTAGMRTMVKGARILRYTVNGRSVIADRDLVDIINSNENLTMFARAIRVAGLDSMLRGPGPFTIFAPSDSAFSAMPSDYVNSLFRDTSRLRQVVQYHVLPGRIDSGAAMIMTSPTTSPTLEGSTLQVTTSSGNVMVNGGRVFIPDLAATNGIIHVVDTVFTPPSLISTTPLPTVTAPTMPSGTTTQPAVP
jgi:uncharacterized surface protein with fasciclin (FAS1) repeats